jgi:phytoene desaturase
VGKLIVIGAGIAGLSTAVHAARNGYEVEVLEHHNEPGGVCTAWQRGGYTIEGCIHWLMGSKPDHPMWRLYHEVGATQGLELLPVDQFVRFVDEPSGLELDFTSDLDRTLAQVEGISPADRPVFQEIVDAAREHDLVRMMPIDAPELTSVWSWIATGWKSRKDLLWMMTHRRPTSDLVGRVRHPVLRDFLARMFPDIPFAFASAVLGDLSRGSLATIAGGSHRFAHAIAARVNELGGVIRYGQDVEEIIVENDRAVGVRTVGGVEYRADRVVSCAPGPTTIFRMLGGRYTDDAIRRRYAEWPLFEPIALVSFGSKRVWNDLPRSNQFHLAQPFVMGPRPTTELMVRNYAFDPTLAPAGHSVIQAMVPTDFDLWHDLHHAPHRYATKKAELAEAVLARIERHVPGLSDTVEMTDVATPYTFWRFARSHRGAFEGFLPTAEAFGKHLRKTLPGLERFHMAGQWVEPGGGVPPAVYSGRQVVQLICDEDGRRFEAN